MKQIYRRSDSVRISRTTILVGIGVCALGIAVLLFSPVRSAISDGVYQVAPGLWETGDATKRSVSNFFSGFKAKESLAEENDVLREELSLMRAHVLDRNLLEDRVVELEEILGRTRSDNRVIARVLAMPGRWSPYDMIVIDIGEDHGVLVGNRVMYGNSVIGEVAEVHAQSAKVQLFSSPGDELNVLIGTTTISAVARGRGMGNFEARIPQGNTVLVGENVFTSENLIIGTVGAVIEHESMPFIRILFTTPFNITEMRTVEVVRGSHVNLLQ